MTTYADANATPQDAPMIPKRVSLVTTTLNCAAECASLLDSLQYQTRMPDEIIVVDGGSTDGTPDIVRMAAKLNTRIRLISAPGANIGQGRNIGIEAAYGDVILSTDTGCRLDPQWVQCMVEPFERDPGMQFVAGTYKIDPTTLMESVVGLATMRGALEPIDPNRFNPSCRSMGFTKALWTLAGRFPDWIEIDDTLFNMKLRKMELRRCVVDCASVHWRPRGTLRGLYRQFRFYAKGRGHTQLGVEGANYNVRNLAICVALAVGGLLHFTSLIALLVAFLYFYVVAFHGKSMRVAAATKDWRAYPLSLIVHITVNLATVDGHLRGALDRLRDRARYQQRTEDYLACAP